MLTKDYYGNQTNHVDIEGWTSNPVDEDRNFWPPESYNVETSFGIFMYVCLVAE